MKVSLIVLLAFSRSGVVTAFTAISHRRTRSILWNHDDNNRDQEKDWRDFRARLVQQESQLLTNNDVNIPVNTPIISSSGKWAYETSFIEKGTIILSHPKPSFGGGLLRHPFWHKAVMLILDHNDESIQQESETLGIFLNRHTDFIHYDNNQSWNIWYGGPVHCGLQFADLNTAELICLHSLSCNEARRSSKEIVRDIYYTTLKNAKKLVKDGFASSNDFITFAGYCGWSQGQLKQELEEGSWFTIASDSGTLLQELSLQKNSTSEHLEIMIQDAGMSIWNTFASLIGKSDGVPSLSFEDLLLKEWARDNLCNNSAKTQQISFDADITIKPGMILRAKAHPRSPFLLSDQDMHKSVVLVVSENIYGTVGVILNLPTTKTVDLDKASLLMRYGGSYVVFGEGERPLLWLHCNDRLRQASTGIPFDEFNIGGVWECTPDDVANCIRSGIASPNDFMVVSGGYIWVKDNNGETGGMRAEVWNGRFEVISVDYVQSVWNTLLIQQVMTRETLDQNLATSSNAWNLASPTKIEEDKTETIFGCDMKLSLLEDESRRRWVAKYVLNDPDCIT
jgi:putative AlgH/UPF0301 family transcriptional regulator